MKILIVDDEKLARLNIKRQLDQSFEIVEVSTLEDAITKINEHNFDLCFTDLMLDLSGSLKGLDVIPHAQTKGIYTIVMSSIEDDLVAEKAFNLGAKDIYIKGNEEESVAEILNRYFMSLDQFTEDHVLNDLIKTNNKAYKDNLKKLIKIVKTNIPISILGESGTGKSFLAKIIHDLSKRPGPFIEINCASFSGDTLKSELFGHMKGSFTGAIQDYQGKLAQANHGTLFLDEIGNMSLEMQETLLKAIEQQSFYPIGSNKLVKSNFRIICATLDSFEDLILKGKFRFDFYQRISGYTFTQPALRDRKEDLFSLLKDKLNRKRKIIFKQEAKELIELYEWPGNIRELQQFAEVISKLDRGLITKEDVGPLLKNNTQITSESGLTTSQWKIIKEHGLRDFLEILSSQAVELALKENDQKATAAIKQLNISPATFYKYDRREKIQARHLSQEVQHELH